MVNFINFLISNWVMIVIICAALGVIVHKINNYLNSPTEEQLKSLKEWLLYAVTAAEKEFGSKTGQIKLSYVYGLFIEKFPKLSLIVPFDFFSELVDEVLVSFRNMVESNKEVDNYINKENK